MAGILNFSIKPLSSITPSLGFQTQFPKTRFRIRTNSYISIQNPSIIHLNFHPRFIVTPISASSSNPINDDGGITNNSGNVLEFTRPLLNFAANNFLPLALVGGVAFGLATPSLGCLADQYSLSKVSTFCIFIISGLTLRSQEIGAARDAWPVGIFGLASILLLTPVFSRLILQLNFQPQEFVTGTIAKFMYKVS